MGNPLFQMGVGILANNGHVGKGLQSGMLGMNAQQRMQMARQQMGAQSQARAQAQAWREKQAGVQQSQWQQTFDANQAHKANMLAQGPVSFEQFQGFTPDQKAAYTTYKTTGHKPTEAPSSVREWVHFAGLPPEKQQQYLTMKRANKFMDLGGTVGMMDPTTGIPSQQTPKTLAPAQTPEHKAAVAIAVAEGAASGEALADLNNMKAMQPRLESLVTELSELGRKATYTQAGQAVDATKRQLGLDVGVGAVARKEYVSKVDNEVLPLLRQTFGAAFTENEGKSLKVTLGDPDASPKEKDAVLRSFIQTKREQILSKQRRVGGEAAPIDQPPQHQGADNDPLGIR